MKADRPQIIKEVGFDFSWDVQKVWGLDLPISEMDIKELTWHFEIPFLDDEGVSYSLTPRQVIESPKKYASEYDRMMKADVSYPIDIMENKGRWLILDGLHRLMQQAAKGKDKVKVRIVSRERIPEIAKS